MIHILIEHPIFEYLDFLNFNLEREFYSDTVHTSFGKFCIGGEEFIKAEINIYKLFPIYTSEFFIGDYIAISKFHYDDFFTQSKLCLKSEVFKHKDYSIIHKVSGDQFLLDINNTASDCTKKFVLNNLNLFS